jgi:glucokinase
MPSILAADIGGTNSRFGRFTVIDGKLELQDTAWLQTTEVDSFETLLTRLAERGPEWEAARADVFLVAIAGAVEEERRCAPVNIAWDADLDRIAPRLGLTRAALINDFVAQAYACRTDAVASAQLVLDGTADPNGALAVVGAGTGLGKCALTPIPGSKSWTSVASEGGHTHFPFLTEEELTFLRFVQRETGKRQVVGDMVVTGLGLRLLHRFLTGQDLSPAEVAARFPDPDCPTLEWAARFYGRACHDYALDVLSTGGLYISGGIAAKNPALVQHPSFKAEFRASETHAALMGRIPVRLNANQDSGLWGAAYYGAQRFL